MDNRLEEYKLQLAMRFMENADLWKVLYKYPATYLHRRRRVNRGHAGFFTLDENDPTAPQIDRYIDKDFDNPLYVYCYLRNIEQLSWTVFYGTDWSAENIKLLVGRYMIHKTDTRLPWDDTINDIVHDATRNYVGYTPPGTAGCRFVYTHSTNEVRMATVLVEREVPDAPSQRPDAVIVDPMDYIDLDGGDYE